MINYPALFLAVLRIESGFRDDLGNPKFGGGTGFALTYKKKIIVVTSRHILDANVGVDNSKFSLSKLSLWCRTCENCSIDDSPFKCEVKLADTKIIHHPTADVSIIVSPVLCDLPSKQKLCVYSMDAHSLLADNDFFKKDLEVLTPCAFIGYPSQSDQDPWWDTELGLPIVRMANISSIPSIQFKNDKIKSSHARLVTGLSFSGSSGSLVMNVGTRIKTKAGFVNMPEEIEPRIIGVMGGHFNVTELPPLMKHTGLSYFVSSVAIFELLEKVA